MLLSEVSSLEKEFLVTLYPSSLSFVKYLKLLRVARSSVISDAGEILHRAAYVATERHRLDPH